MPSFFENQRVGYSLTVSWRGRPSPVTSKPGSISRSTSISTSKYVVNACGVPPSGVNVPTATMLGASGQVGNAFDLVPEVPKRLVVITVFDVDVLDLELKLVVGAGGIWPAPPASRR